MFQAKEANRANSGDGLGRANLSAEQTVIVSPELTAKHFGSGKVDVYATPAMVSLMESAALAAIEPQLKEGETTVGIYLDVRHLAATPVGEEVKARAEVTAVDGRKITFAVHAWDGHELIGEGTHVRMIIDRDRFIRRVQSKTTT